MSRLPASLALLLLASAGWAAPQIFRVPAAGKGSPLDSLDARRAGSVIYLSVEQTVQLANGLWSLEGKSASAVFTKGTLTFSVGSPFVKGPDGSSIQSPVSVRVEEGRWWWDADALCRAVNDASSDSLLWRADSPAVEFRRAPVQNPEFDGERDRWALDLVVIDAGHGGKDPGAIGATKLKEKDVTLDVALRLDKALRAKGIKTVLTRRDDAFLPLAERTSIANRSGGKLFISLHCNSAKKRDAVGIETYFLAPTKSDRALEVALLENEVIKYEESRDQYKDLTEENYILLSMAQATFTQESQELAGLMQEWIPPRVGLKNRGVDQAGFYVLVGASMPAVLFEMGFISNKAEEKKLKDKKFRQKLADEIAGAVEKFLGKGVR